jgi:hypothetical protein
VATDTRQQQVAVQLLAAMGQLQGLLSDLWSAMALLGTTCLQSEPAVAAAAAAAAAAGQGLLQGLAAVAHSALGVQEQQQEEEGVGQELQEQLQSEWSDVEWDAHMGGSKQGDGDWAWAEGGGGQRDTV